MENFFYNETFFSDIGDLVDLFDINKKNINELSDDWQVKVELSDLEPIFKIDADILCQLLGDANEERLSEDFNEEENVLKALRGNIDFDKLQEALPKLYYQNAISKTITKADLIALFKCT